MQTGTIFITPPLENSPWSTLLFLWFGLCCPSYRKMAPNSNSIKQKAQNVKCLFIIYDKYFWYFLYIRSKILNLMFNSKKQMALYNVLWQSNEQKNTFFTTAQAISFAFWATTSKRARVAPMNRPRLHFPAIAAALAHTVLT